MKALNTAQALIVLTFLGTAAGSYSRYAPIRQGITWTNCGANVSETYQCGEFDAPLDYGDPSVGKTTIAVVKYPSSAQPRLGTIFVNPGGPGSGGVDFLTGIGPDLSGFTGGQYDIVSWDPRGVGLTQPRIHCFNSLEEENAFWQGTAPTGIEVKGNFTNANETDPNVQAFWAQEPLVDKLLYEVGQKCWAANGDHLFYIGTAAVVRDIIGMTELLDGPGAPVNFWGFSYGTVIGNYLVNMFPDRVGRIIIDGVVNTVLYASSPSYKIGIYEVQDTDKAYTGFLSACAAAGPTACAIAETGSTSESIRSWIQKLMDDAFDYKKAGGQFGSSDIRNAIFQNMYHPTLWVTLASQLYDLGNTLYHNATMPAKRGLSEFTPRFPGSFETPRNGRRSSSQAPNDYAYFAISCADATDAGNTTTADIFREIINGAKTVSEMFSPLFGEGGYWCHKWIARAAERYSGPWNKKLRNPILVIGNKADPITPFAGAKTVADMLGSSAVLVEQDDYGHTSLAEHSDCTINIITEFFTNGKYPTPNQFCGTNQVLFPVPPVTKSTLAAVPQDPRYNPSVPIPGSTQSLNLASTNSSGTGNTTVLQDQIKSLKSDRTTLSVFSGALGLLLALALSAMCFVRIRRRGTRYVAPSTSVPADDQTAYIHKESLLKPARDSTDTLHGYGDAFDSSVATTYVGGGKVDDSYHDGVR